MGTLADPGIAEVGETRPPNTAPSRRARLSAALAAGLASGLFTGLVFAHPPVAPDFEFWWRGAQLLLGGANPYLSLPDTSNWPLPDPLFYPLPTILLSIPLSPLMMPVAGGVFIGISGALLAWLVSREGLWRLWICGSASYLMALKQGQWSPLVSAVAFVPTVGFLAAMKPNIGLALLAYRPSWRAVIGCAAVGIVSFAVLPTWLSDWRANLAGLVSHAPPIMTPIGPFLVLALLRWRRPETRLLLAMACVPQLLFFADQLPLFLIPRTRKEMNTLVLCSAAAFFVWYLRFASNPAYVLAAKPYVLWSTYLPCLVMVLRRPNEGSVPAWVERLVARGRRFRLR